MVVDEVLRLPAKPEVRPHVEMVVTRKTTDGLYSKTRYALYFDDDGTVDVRKSRTNSSKDAATANLDSNLPLSASLGTFFRDSLTAMARGIIDDNAAQLSGISIAAITATGEVLMDFKAQSDKTTLEPDEVAKAIDFFDACKQVVSRWAGPSPRRL
jgi:hypothetical protein